MITAVAEEVESMYAKLKNGYIAEEKFIYKCLSRNIPISRPVYNIEPYDFVVEVNGKFLSVQVKKSWVDKKGRNVVCVKSSYPRSTKSKVVGEQTNVDYLAVLVGYWEWYIIPRHAIKDIKSNLCVSRNGRYQDYYNNWYIG